MRQEDQPSVMIKNGRRCLTARVKVEGGIQWPGLLEFLETAQRGEKQPWTIHQKQTGADRLTLGGALSCNAHGAASTSPRSWAKSNSSSC